LLAADANRKIGRMNIGLLSQQIARWRATWMLSTLGLVLGAALILAGLVPLVVFVSAWMKGKLHVISTGSATGNLEVIALASLCAIAGVLLFRHSASVRHVAQKRLAPDGATLLAKDRRPPILYLRSFADDEIEEPLSAPVPAAGGAIGGAIGGLLVGILGSAAHAALTQEERLADSLGRLGPFVAIGEPGEELPDLGAARLYVAADRWQEVVADLISRARLVVIRPGAGRGLWWEIERVLASVPGDKVAFWLPGTARDGKTSDGVYSELGRFLQPRLSGCIPAWRAAAPYLCFSADWTNPHFKKARELLRSR
jgi:hypothetical protein